MRTFLVESIQQYSTTTQSLTSAHAETSLFKSLEFLIFILFFTPHFLFICARIFSGKELRVFIWRIASLRGLARRPIVFRVGLLLFPANRDFPSRYLRNGQFLSGSVKYRILYMYTYWKWSWKEAGKVGFEPSFRCHVQRWNFNPFSNLYWVQVAPVTRQYQ